jgi:integrase/recombinase XerD
MLGHAKLTSTQVYTRVSIAKLKAVHTATHPAATLARRESAGADAPPLAAEEVAEPGDAGGEAAPAEREE